MRNRSITVWILFTTLFPLFLGGDYERWMQGIVLCMMGALFLVSPLRSGLKHGIGWFLLALFAVSLSAFLPATLLGIPEWRNEVTALGINLPWTLSPQPWLSLDYVLLLGAGLLWLYYLSARTWEKEDRLFAMRALGVSLLAFTLLSLAGHFIQWTPPLWEGQRYFGPIANRNQMAIILCLTALVSTGCAYYELHGRHKWRAVPWAAGLPLVFLGLVVNMSRSGVLLFFGGMAAWIALISIQKRSTGTFAAAGSVLLLLAAAFFLYGGRTLERFTIDEESLASAVKGEARFEIFGESLNLITEAPVFGTGFANFGPVYALSRDVENSAILARVAQPDNDWLWLGVEIGLAGLILAIIIVILLARRALPLSGRSRHDRRSAYLRVAALVSVAVFCADGLVNIPGHRMAVALIGILLMGLAQHSNRRRHSSLLLASLYRSGGAVLILIGITWIAASWMKLPIPGGIEVALYEDKAFKADLEEDHENAVKWINRVIALQPLRYRHYFKRAAYAARGGAPLEGVIADFEIARRLEPTHPIIPLGEAEFWLETRASFALPAIEDAMRRDPPSASRYFRMMAERADIDPSFRAGLSKLAFLDPELQIVYFVLSEPEEVFAQIERIVKTDAALANWDRLQKRNLFSYWYRFGDREKLISKLGSNPDWEEAGWRELCRFHAEQDDFEAALEVAHRHLTPPTLPRLYERRSIADLRTAFVSNPSDVNAGIRLWDAESRLADHDAAASALEKVTRLPTCPDYAFYILAQTLEKLERYRESWENLEVFMRKVPPQ